MPNYVLDTSAIMCVLYEEEGIEYVLDVLCVTQFQSSSNDTLVLIPFVSMMETEYRLLRRFPSRRVEEIITLVENWPVIICESNYEWRHEAARVKSLGGLSLADAWVASLAILLDAQLVHKDPEFDQLPNIRALRLPYKRPTR